MRSFGSCAPLHVVARNTFQGITGREGIRDFRPFNDVLPGLHGRRPNLARQLLITPLERKILRFKYGMVDAAFGEQGFAERSCHPGSKLTQLSASCGDQRRSLRHTKLSIVICTKIAANDISAAGQSPEVKSSNPPRDGTKGMARRASAAGSPSVERVSAALAPFRNVLPCGTSVTARHTPLIARRLRSIIARSSMRNGRDADGPIRRELQR